MAAAFGRLALQLLPSLFGNGSGRIVDNERSREFKKQLEEREKANSTSASGRHHIVKQVMRERGVSLPQASSIVKREGLYVPRFGKGGPTRPTNDKRFDKSLRPPKDMSPDVFKNTQRYKEREKYRDA